jgi:hypothetical protein
MVTPIFLLSITGCTFSARTPTRGNPRALEVRKQGGAEEEEEEEEDKVLQSTVAPPFTLDSSFQRDI